MANAETTSAQAAEQPLTLDSDELLVVIASDNAYFYVSRAGDLISHGRSSAATSTRTADVTNGNNATPMPTVDVFDCAGRRMVPEVDDTMTVVGFRRAGKPHRDLVLIRMEQALASVDRILAQHSDLQGPDGGDRAVPRGLGSLSEQAAHYAALGLLPDAAEVLHDRGDHYRGWGWFTCVMNTIRKMRGR